MVQMNLRQAENPQEPSDGALLRAWTDGDPSAFTELVRRNESGLIRHAMALLGGSGAYEDVVQDALLKLARGGLVIPADVAGDPEAERRVLSAWLHKVVRNGCMDVIKTEGRRRARERAAAAPEAAPERAPEVEVEDTQGTVRAAIAALPVDQREVLSLRLFEEKSYRDIAEVTGKKVGTIGWLISEGLQVLAVRLAPVLGEAGNTAMNIGTTSGGA
jgi:RNA polymerase sigma-70 factor (ECF subfamily)